MEKAESSLTGTSISGAERAFVLEPASPANCEGPSYPHLGTIAAACAQGGVDTTIREFFFTTSASAMGTRTGSAPSAPLASTSPFFT